MQHYGIAVPRWYEIRFAIIGKIISASCYVIGWFMPFFFAGKLESGNVCEYFWMKQYFNKPGIHDWDLILYEMGMKEKEHEIYFLNKIKQSKVLPYFERLFNWGFNKSANNIDLDKKTRWKNQTCIAGNNVSHQYKYREAGNVSIREKCSQLFRDSLHKLIFFTPRHIKRNAIFHYHLSAFSLYIFYYQVFVNNIRMMNPDKNSSGQ